MSDTEPSGKPRWPSLDGYLQAAYDEFEEQLGEWEDEAYGKSVTQFAECVAEILADFATDLVHPKAGVPGSLASWHRGLESFGSDRQEAAGCMLQLELATRFLPSTQSMVDRAGGLLALAGAHDAGEAVHRFLRRVARTYLLGLDNESVVMCRAVLDNALEDRFRRDDAVPDDAEGKPASLAQAIAAAYERGWIDDAVHRDAHVVRIRGDKAANDDPHAVTESLDTIRRTMAVVRAL